MTQFTQIKPQTATASSTNAPFYTDQYDCITVSADALVGTETVGIFMRAGAADIVVALPDGTPAQLTAANPAFPLEGGPRYIFVKSATASPCGVYIDAKEHT